MVLSTLNTYGDDFILVLHSAVNLHSELISQPWPFGPFYCSSVGLFLGERTSTIFSGCFQAGATYLLEVLAAGSWKLTKPLESLPPQENAYFVWLPRAAISPFVLVNSIDVYASVFPTK